MITFVCQYIVIMFGKQKYFFTAVKLIKFYKTNMT
jgi:hypothetical protein